LYIQVKYLLSLLNLRVNLIFFAGIAKLVLMIRQWKLIIQALY